MTRTPVPRRSPRASRTLRLLAAAGIFVSCASDDLRPRGQLTLHITSDLASPKDMAQVQVEVRRPSGELITRNYYDLKPLEPGFPMPGTVAVIPPDAGGQSLLIRVSGRKLVGENPVRVVREAYVKVPKDFNARLHMPLRWLCDGHTRVNDAGEVVSDCEDHQTCVAGVCQTSDIEPESLPEFAESDVFGQGNALGEGSTCLDAQLSFKDLPVQEPDQDCQLPLPAGASPNALNVALVLEPRSEGHCLTAAEGGTCFVPLDKDPTEGFDIADGRIKLPKAVCQRLEADPTRVRGVSVSTRFPTKDSSVPTCGPWLPYEPKEPEPAVGDAGSDSGGAGGNGETDERAGTGPVASTGGTSGATDSNEAGADSSEAGARNEDPTPASGAGGSSTSGSGTGDAGGSAGMIGSAAGGMASSGGGADNGPNCAYPGVINAPSPMFMDGYGRSLSESWYGMASSYQYGNATVAPLSTEANNCFVGTEVCVAGTVEADVNSGAGIQWNMNQTESSSTPGPVTLDLSMWVQIAGAQAGMRIELVEPEGAAPRYCYALTATDAERAQDDGLTLFPSDFKESCWDEASTSFYEGSELTGIQVVVPGDASKTRTFDFCLISIEPQFLN